MYKVTCHAYNILDLWLQGILAARCPPPINQTALSTKEGYHTLCPFPCCVGWWEMTRLQAYYLSPIPKHTHLILQVDWVPTEDRGPQGAEGRATFNPPIAVALIITLYRVSHPSLSSPSLICFSHLLSCLLLSSPSLTSSKAPLLGFSNWVDRFIFKVHIICVCAMHSCLLCQLKVRWFTNTSTFMFVFACANVWCAWQCYLFS